jgi:hypothetical protein
MILFEANAVAPLVNLPDAAVEETVQFKMEMYLGIAASVRYLQPDSEHN